MKTRITYVIMLAVAMLMMTCCRKSFPQAKDHKNETAITIDTRGESSKTDVTVVGSPKAKNNKSADKILVSGDITESASHPLLLTTTKRKLDEQLIMRKSYLTSYNKQTLCPNWVGWCLTREHADGPVDRFNAFHEDEDVPSPRATASDYKGSGWTRGHMCPAGDNKWDHDAMFDTFSFINICPQNANLNNGMWNSFEMDCRKWAKKYGEIYIVCGPIFYNKEQETIGSNKVSVPEAFFKVMLVLTPEPKAFGFIAKNTDGQKKTDLYYNSIDQVERITGYDFFSALPDDIEEAVEAQEPQLDLW